MFLVIKIPQILVSPYIWIRIQKGSYAYRDWLRLGFAIADGLGEDGRQLFHELSRLCPKYDEAECDKQYTHCLNGRGSGVTVKTFFQMAKEAGVELSATSAKMPHGINGVKDAKMVFRLILTSLCQMAEWQKWQKMELKALRQ